MSAPVVPPSPLTRAESWRLILRKLSSPPVLVAVAFLCLSTNIYSALIYVSLRTFLVVPNGGLVWGALVLTLVGTAVGFGRFIYELVLIRRLRKLGIRRAPNMWPFTAWFVSLHLAIPFAAALVLWKDMGDPAFLIKRRGKYAVMSKRQNLEHMLHVLEKRGVFTSLLK